MQTLQQELDPSPQGLTTHDHPVLRGHVADQAVAYAEEVHMLRQRVVVLEAALAQANKAARRNQEAAASEAPRLPAVDFAPPCHPSFISSEFALPVMPAVVVVSPGAPKPAQEAPATTATEPETVASDPGFAQAWTEGDATFEERVAEKAFFQVGTVDEQSRTWLLGES